MKTVLVIVPTYNEAANIERLIKKIWRVGAEAEHVFEVLVVDDNSPDGTGQIVKKIQTKDSRLHLLSGRRQGLGKAYVRGFKHGLKKGGYDAFVMMDADFSHDPAVIPNLLKALDAGADYVIGSRYVPGGGTADNWSRRRLLQSRLANSLARWLVGHHGGIKDQTSGFKALRSSALAKISLEQVSASGYVFQVNLLHAFAKAGYKLAEVPIIFADRTKGKSKLRLRDVVEFLYLTYRLNPDSTVRRLVRFGFVGAVGTLVNLGVLFLLVQGLGAQVLLAVAIAIEVSIVSNFFMNHLFTFRFHRAGRLDSTATVATKLVRYNFITLGGAAISYLVFLACYKWLGWHYIISDLIAIIVATSWNYMMSVRVVWKVVDA